MDVLTLLGLATAFIAIIVGQIFEGGDLQSLMNFPALLIVLGGTLGAVMVQTPWTVFKYAFNVLSWVVKPPDLNFKKGRERLVELARNARQFGLLSLEDEIEKEDNPLLSKGLELLVMGVDTQTIQDILEAEIERGEYQDLKAAYVFESMGGYSPTIGILGAVLGLIQVMRNLSDPGALGTGIAVAFVATIYGVGLANLIFLPVANKLKSCVARHVQYDMMIIEGIISMAAGESPTMIQMKLENYGQLNQNERKKKKQTRGKG